MVRGVTQWLSLHIRSPPAINTLLLHYRQTRPLDRDWFLWLEFRR